MNGGQDLGGMHGFGPVAPEPNEPVFHEPWERRVFAMAMAMGFTGAWTLDGSRAARESMPPGDYMRAPYYAIWLDALERQLAALGLARPDEIARGTAAIPTRSPWRGCSPPTSSNRASAPASRATGRPPPRRGSRSATP